MTELLKGYTEAVETALYNFIPKEKTKQDTVHQAVRYSIEAGGKRLRPVIMLMTAKMLGLPFEEIIPFACALEMIHTYSLIHDDLPCMDNDDMRRGKPTNHKVYGEAMAVLAGDALLNMACETVTCASYRTDADTVLRALGALYRASGSFGMIGGQVIDLENEGKQTDKDTLRELHLLKTGALIKAAGEIACIMAHADKEKTDAVVKYCTNLGIAFQIRDDLLDVYGDSSELGKNVGSDEANNKTTYVTIYGRDTAERLVLEHTKTAVDSLLVFGDKGTELKELAEFLIARKN